MKKHEAKPTIFDVFAEESALAIEMRRLYSRMRQKTRGTSTKCFMVTSASMSEGKSTVSTYLAMTVARHKKTKTILVDADLRKSSIHKHFGVTREPGLAECLAGRRDIMDCVRDTPLDALKVMSAGRHEAAPSYLFDTHRLGEVFSELKFYFDTVVVDSPPVIPVSDPVILCQEMDGVLLVVMAGVTPRELVLRARDVLHDVDANIMGVVVNNHAEVLPYYYGHKYYGYRDSSLAQAEPPRARDARPVPVGAEAEKDSSR
ncbi:MAG: CpsD/CapB family tyrosine-protein kinase [Candidatus Krumholzibacteriia bacterium]